jgi:hypothetical protein
MKKQSFIQTLVIAAILVFASCKKENATETQAIDAKVEEASNIPEKDTYTNTDLKENFPMEIKMEKKEGLISEKRSKGGMLAVRNSTDPVTRKTSSTQADFSSNTIYCGSRITSTTIGRFNNYDDHFYGQLGFDTYLNGGDKVYYITLTQEQIVNFYLTNTYRNLAMMLFKGNYYWENGHVVERFDDLEAWSTSTSPTDERLANLRLTPGKYMLIIDSAPNAGSQFTLSVTCTPVSTSCNSTPGYGLFYDNFEHYYLGNISTQSPNWNNWGGHYYDGQVAAGKYLKVDYVENAPAYQQPNFSLDLGQRTTGNYQLEFSMWVYNENTASIFMEKVINSELGAGIYIGRNGQAGVYAENRLLTSFTYPTNKWAKVRLDVNLNSNVTSLYIDGFHKASWYCTNSYNAYDAHRRMFRGLKFSATHYGRYFIDNVCYIQRF